METAKILTADLLDIVFDGRNKSYGAYELRRHYRQRMTKALLITAGICITIGGGAWLKSTFAKTVESDVLRIIPDVTISNVEPIEEELPPPPPPPPAPKVEVPKIKTIDYTTPVLTNEPIVEPPPTQTDLVDTKISNITQDGIANANIVVPPESLDGDRGLITSSRPKEDDDKTFIKVEIEASYIGDWRRFLERNLSGEVAVDNGAAPGLYTVIIEFIVDKQGNVSNIKPLTNKGFGMEQEAMRVIKRSGKWKPAFQNSHEVKAYRKQPITFQVVEQ
ncbi:energy transducer TonB [Niabella ginsengisoli]|uniref:Energy transducer TonB n=1 Tax=Niabella ginsengisoli TaxID=522298 RepID=A0ABS9SDU6_9BACT|nr:energy transducer TonB [Niabella ginsengisoli]MCH5596518.1 energy transducer TonB [Niabella ginsengisoli]